MVLTRSFKDHVKAKIESDPAFRQALFQEAVQTLISGDVDTARAVLRDFINATIGFAALAKATGTPSKSLMRMFGPNGNPTAANLFAVIGVLQEKDGRPSRSPRDCAGSLKAGRRESGQALARRAESRAASARAAVASVAREAVMPDCEPPICRRAYLAAAKVIAGIFNFRLCVIRWPR